MGGSPDLEIDALPQKAEVQPGTAGLKGSWASHVEGEGWGRLQTSGTTYLLSPEDAAVKGRLVECLETVLNKAQEPPKSKKVQHSNAKNAILFETISLIIHYDRCCRQGCGEAGPLARGRRENRICLRREGWHLTPGSKKRKQGLNPTVRGKRLGPRTLAKKGQRCEMHL